MSISSVDKKSFKKLAKTISNFSISIKLLIYHALIGKKGQRTFRQIFRNTKQCSKNSIFYNETIIVFHYHYNENFLSINDPFPLKYPFTHFNH